jgi:hypothetical protein
MHGGGSADGAKLIINAKTDVNQYIDLVKRLININEDIINNTTLKPSKNLKKKNDK